MGLLVEFGERMVVEQGHGLPQLSNVPGSTPRAFDPMAQGLSKDFGFYAEGV